MKPLRIRIVDVGLTDNIDKLAAKMEVPDRDMERFLILNGIERTAKLSYGEELKIVAD